MGSLLKKTKTCGYDISAISNKCDQASMILGTT